VACFLKVEDKPIRAMTSIYHPDVLLCSDPTVSKAVNIFLGMNRDGVLVQAARGGIEALSLPPEVAKRPITNNIIMLGALARTTGLVMLGALKIALEAQEFHDAGLKQNFDAVTKGFEETTIQCIECRA
jgi:pyruvate ferredoxin oxidoreductase gamma subunit/phenylglyoxylate dehydrogenase gamma subunit